MQTGCDIVMKQANTTLDNMTIKQQIADFTPLCTTHDENLLVFVVEQNVVGILAFMPVVFYCHFRIHMMCNRAIM